MQKKISARKASVVPLDCSEALKFLAEFHRSGGARINSNSRAFGIYYESELLGVALFGSPRTARMQKRFRFELQRMAFKNEVRVIGGASKLIAAFKKTSPTDFFTYQDTAGETTDVYEHAGMTLVGPKNPRKKVLVLNGLTKVDAKNNRKDWFSLEQATRFGPDNLIGTELGERYEGGKRISNIDLFIRYCDYHLEDVPGDRFYEWRNPDVLFYTYKITSSTKSGYYIGRHGLRGKGLTISDCLADNYMGSGGAKYKNWLTLVDPSTLHKEILGTYDTWEKVVSAETALVGDLYKDDPLCKNLRPGGIGNEGYSGLGPVITKATCPIHGFVNFSKDKCCTCTSNSSITFRSCNVHGESLHRGLSCLSCAKLKGYSSKECAIHGLTTFSKGGCWQCAQDSSWKTKECPIHGETSFHGNSCVKCLANKSINLRNCSIHGETVHQGTACRKCSGEKSVSLELCSIHGETKFRGKACYRCQAVAITLYEECKIHGHSRHQKGICIKCSAIKEIIDENCVIHGVTKHRKGICYRCNASKSVGERECSIHGSTKFRGDVCQKCKVASSKKREYRPVFAFKNCATHGETKHNGDSCAKCSISKRESKRECSIHGLTKFQGNSCAKCNSASLVSIKFCSVHGDSKHRGNSCYKCMGVKAKAKREGKENDV